MSYILYIYVPLNVAVEPLVNQFLLKLSLKGPIVTSKGIYIYKYKRNAHVFSMRYLSATPEIIVEMIRSPMFLGGRLPFPGQDQLTSHLWVLQKLPAFQKLERTEQLGLLVLAVYLRNPP